MAWVPHGPRVHVWGRGRLPAVPGEGQDRCQGRSKTCSRGSQPSLCCAVCTVVSPFMVLICLLDSCGDRKDRGGPGRRGAVTGRAGAPASLQGPSRLSAGCAMRFTWTRVTRESPGARVLPPLRRQQLSGSAVQRSTPHGRWRSIVARGVHSFSSLRTRHTTSRRRTGHLRGREGSDCSVSPYCSSPLQVKGRGCFRVCFGNFCHTRRFVCVSHWCQLCPAVVGTPGTAQGCIFGATRVFSRGF